MWKSSYDMFEVIGATAKLILYIVHSFVIILYIAGNVKRMFHDLMRYKEHAVNKTALGMV